MADVQRWTGLVAAFDGGGFVCYGDYLTIEKQLAASQQREAELVAHVERLREAIEEGLATYQVPRTARICEALVATPAQSLARLRNEVLEEVAKACEQNAIYGKKIHGLGIMRTPAMNALVKMASDIRAMKELK